MNLRAVSQDDNQIVHAENAIIDWIPLAPASSARLAPMRGGATEDGVQRF
jgi:hypothetical protein